MMRRKCFSVSKKAAATQRAGMPARQRQTRRVRIRTPDCELSIKLVVGRQRCSENGTSNRFGNANCDSFLPRRFSFSKRVCTPDSRIGDEPPPNLQLTLGHRRSLVSIGTKKPGGSLTENSQ